MELEERRDVEAIRGTDEIEDLPVEHRRSVVVGSEPARGVQNELNAYQCHLAIGGLVDERLRLRWVKSEIAQQGAIDVVHAHRPVVGTRDATKKWSIAGYRGVVNIDIPTRSCTNQFDQGALRRGLMSGGMIGSFLGGQKRRGNNEAAEQSQT